MFRTSAPKPLFWQILRKSDFLSRIPLVGSYSKPLLKEVLRCHHGISLSEKREQCLIENEISL